MYIRTICLATALFLNVFAFSQEDQVVRNVTKVSVLSPGLSYEIAVGKFQTLYLHGFASPSLGISSSSMFGTTFYFYLDPAFAINYRFYYLRKRQEKGNRIHMNSLNYVAPLLITTFSRAQISESDYAEQNRRPIFLTGIVWGMQRNYNSRFSLDLQLGAGALATKVTVQGPADQPVRDHVFRGRVIADITLGFWLNKRE